MSSLNDRTACLVEDNGCQLGHSSRREMTAGASATVHPYKSKHHLVHDEDSSDEVTTAYSSWVEDNSSQLSSCGQDDDDDSQLSCPKTIVSQSSSSSLLSTRDAEYDYDEEHGLNEVSYSADEDEEDDLLMRYLSHSSSYYSAVSSHLDVAVGYSDSEYHFEIHPSLVTTSQTNLQSRSNKRADVDIIDEDALYELTERAHHMLQREQSPDYKIDNYFLHQDSDATLLASLSSNYSPIDMSCRSKMIEWSIRVLEFSFPLSLSRQHQAGRSSRKYSEQVIQIVSQAFSLVDRLASRHFHQNNYEAMDRSQYKLICMGCLHITAKSCGLFGLYDGEVEFEMDEEEGSPTTCELDQQSFKDEVVASDECRCYLKQSSTSSLSFSSMTTRDSTPASEYDDGQTIVSTPEPTSLSDPVDQGGESNSTGPPKSISIEEESSQAAPCQDQSTSIPVVQKRPPLNILSLTALSALCRNEYSLDELVDSEMNILKTLDWKVMSATSVDWCHLLLDILVLCSNVHDGEAGNGRAIIDTEELHEHTLANIECAIETNLLFDPSLVAMAAVEHALDRIEDGYGFELQCIVSVYKKIVWSILPHGVEEVNSVRLCL